jgi:hypothetical protein
MKRLALLSFTIATGAVVAAIEGTPMIDASEQAEAQQCVTFPSIPNPEAELRYMLSDPNTRVCSSARNPYEAYQSEQAVKGILGNINQELYSGLHH